MGRRPLLAATILPQPWARGFYCTAMPFPRLLLGTSPSARLLEGGHSHLPVRSITMRGQAIFRLRSGSLKQPCPLSQGSSAEAEGTRALG